MHNRGYLYVKALSDLGSRMDVIVLGALILASTGSAVWLSALLGVSVLGGLLSGFVSGAVADRFDRKRIMLVADWVRGGLILLLIPFPQPEMILLVRFLMGLTGSFFEVSYNAEIPQIYGRNDLLSVNALIARLGAISTVLGFLGGGLMQDRLGYESVLMLDAASFVISALFLMRMKWNREEHKDNRLGGKGRSAILAAIRAQVYDLKEVSSYLKVRSGLLIVFLLYLLDTFGSASHNLGIPLLADLLSTDHQAFYYGLIWSVWGAGNVVATYGMTRWKISKNRYGLAYLAATPFMSLGFIAIFASNSLKLILISAVLTGVVDAFAATVLMTLFQQSDNRIRGRLFGVSTVLNRLGFGIGFLLAPWVLRHFTLFPMVLAFHGVVIAASLIGIYLYLKRSGTHGQTDSYDKNSLGV